MKEKLFYGLAFPFLVVALTLLSFGEGGWRKVISDWRDFLRETEGWKHG